MRYAAIDIGTNTILMLIADVMENGELSVISDEHFIARLGKGVDEHGVINENTFRRAHDILEKLKDIALRHSVHKIFSCGTSALRDATNKNDFLEFIRKKLSIDVRILSGEEEAMLTYLGAVSEYLTNTSVEEYAVFDIGGGSTELVTGHGEKIKSSTSVNIGSVRLTERILKASPPDTYTLEMARNAIRSQIAQLPILSSTVKLIGVAGTLTTLAALDLQLPVFDRNKINRHILRIDSIIRIFDELKTCTIEELKSYPQIHPQRADILLAGILILVETMKKVALSEIIVSDRGLRYGLLLDSIKLH